jgi:hypothetical protein
LTFLAVFFMGTETWAAGRAKEVKKLQEQIADMAKNLPQ